MAAAEEIRRSAGSTTRSSAMRCTTCTPTYTPATSGNLMRSAVDPSGVTGLNVRHPSMSSVTGIDVAGLDHGRAATDRGRGKLTLLASPAEAVYMPRAASCSRSCARATSARSPVARSRTSTRPSPEASPDHHRPRHAEQFGVGELHPDGDPGPVVDQVPAARRPPARRPRSSAAVGSPIATTCTCGRCDRRPASTGRARRGAARRWWPRPGTRRCRTSPWSAGPACRPGRARRGRTRRRSAGRAGRCARPRCPAGSPARPPQTGQGSPARTATASIGAVRDRSRARRPRGPRAGRPRWRRSPRRCPGDPRVDEVAGRRSALRPDVALDQLGCAAKSSNRATVVGYRAALDPLEVDLAVPGHPDDQHLLVAGLERPRSSACRRRSSRGAPRRPAR